MPDKIMDSWISQVGEDLLPVQKGQLKRVVQDAMRRKIEKCAIMRK
jgi:hypothetical protein